jgi:hypothetical protein
MKTITHSIIDFAITRHSHRFDRVIPAGSEIVNVRPINERFSSFFSPSVLDTKGNSIEMYADTSRLNSILQSV